jgi:hypothetical protein
MTPTVRNGYVASVRLASPLGFLQGCSPKGLSFHKTANLHPRVNHGQPWLALTHTLKNSAFDGRQQSTQGGSMRVAHSSLRRPTVMKQFGDIAGPLAHRVPAAQFTGSFPEEGRGGGNRNCIPITQVLNRQKRSAAALIPTGVKLCQGLPRLRPVRGFDQSD